MIWDNKVTEAKQELIRADDTLTAWKVAKKYGPTYSLAWCNSESCSWIPPPHGYLKCNLDASFNQTHNKLVWACAFRMEMVPSS